MFLTKQYSSISETVRNFSLLEASDNMTWIDGSGNISCCCTKEIEDVVDMGGKTGHNKNVDKSRLLATTRPTRRVAGHLEIKGLHIIFANGRKLLGHKCAGERKFITTGSQEAAVEARLRTGRI